MSQLTVFDSFIPRACMLSVPLSGENSTGDGAHYLNFMRKEASQVVGNFLLALGSCGRESSGMLHTAIDTFCQELDQCLIRIRSLPPSCPGVVVLELGLLYNLLYASITKACSQKQPPDIISPQAGLVLLSLRRAQQVLAVDKGTQEADSQQRAQTGQQQVPSVLSTLLTSLHTVNTNKELGESVGLLACLWSLLTLLEKGASSPLPWLSSLPDWPVDTDKVVLKHGFVLSPSTPTLYVDRDDSNNKTPDRGLVQNFANLLLAVSCFHRQKWKECREHASKVNLPLWKPVATLLTARAMLDNGHCLEAVGILHTALSGGTHTASPVMVCQTYRLLASCYSAQSLPHLAVEMLRRCLRMQPGSTAALLMLARQFQSLQQVDAEMECLRALVKASENAWCKDGLNTQRPPLLDDLLQEVMTAGEGLTLSQAVYHLASRAAQLKRYEEASQAYLKLIQIYEKKGVNKTQQQPQLATELCYPDLLTVCREAAQVLLLVPQHKHCLQLCDRVLNAVSSSPPSSKPLSDLDCFFQSSEEHQRTDESWTESQADTSADERDLVFEFKSGRKRRLSSSGGDQFGDGEEQTGMWEHEENRILLLVCKAECLVAEGDYSTTVKVLNRALEGLMECWQWVGGQRPEEAEPGPSWRSPVASVAKRPRYSLSGHTEEAAPAGKAEQVESWRQLSSQVCIYLSDAFSRLEEHGQARHAARLAAQVKPGDEDALYYLSHSLMEMGRGKVGCQTWLHHRGLPHNTGSVRLESSVQQRQDMISMFAADNSCSNIRRKLGTVTDRQKLQLDLSYLNLLVDARSKR